LYAAVLVGGVKPLLVATLEVVDKPLADPLAEAAAFEALGPLSPTAGGFTNETAGDANGAGVADDVPVNAAPGTVEVLTVVAGVDTDVPDVLVRDVPLDDAEPVEPTEPVAPVELVGVVDVLVPVVPAPVVTASPVPVVDDDVDVTGLVCAPDVPDESAEVELPFVDEPAALVVVGCGELPAAVAPLGVVPVVPPVVVPPAVVPAVPGAELVVDAPNEAPTAVPALAVVVAIVAVCAFADVEAVVVDAEPDEIEAAAVAPRETLVALDA
jgi:hypothetical protein